MRPATTTARNLVVCLLLGAALWLLTWSASPVQAFSSGQTGHSGSPLTGGVTCAACHSGADEAATVSISGPSTLIEGTTATFTVTVGAGPGELAGFNAAFTEASTLLAGANTAIVSGEATHAQAVPAGGAPVSFQFDWTAPSVDVDTPVTVHAAGVSADASGDPSGDAVASTQFSLTVAPEPVALVFIDPGAEADAEPIGNDPAPERGETPVAVASGGAFGFGLQPQTGTGESAGAGTASPAQQRPELAVSGATTDLLAAIGVAAMAVGATLHIGDRRRARHRLCAGIRGSLHNRS